MSQDTAKLHYDQRHPDYEYARTQAPSGAYADLPKGSGWTANNDMFGGTRNWEELNQLTFHYWKRPKADAQKDRSPFDLSPVVLPGVQRDEFLGMLRARFPKGYMPSATGEVEFTSKPEYCEHQADIVGLWAGTRTYVWSPEYYTRAVATNAAPFLPIVEREIYFGVDLPQSKVQILLNLKNPDVIAVRCRRLDQTHVWADWQPWQEGQVLHVNPYELKEQIDVYG